MEKTMVSKLNQVHFMKFDEPWDNFSMLHAESYTKQGKTVEFGLLEI